MKDPDRKKTFLSIFEELSKNRSEKGANGHPYPGLPGGYEEEQEENYETTYDLTDEIDHQILMHRDAHFGGDFSVMLDYYHAEGSVGIHPDFDPERIAYLADVEKEMGQNLAPLILSGAEAEAVGQSRLVYSQLKEIYELDKEAHSLARLIADLVLSEEEEPEREIEAVVAQGTRILPDLLALLGTDEMYDPLYPGYGYAPYLAIICLGKIGDPNAVIPLFETLCKPLVFDEMVVVEALYAIGEPAKEFLLRMLKGRPVTQDNSNAAFALSAFSNDPAVARASFEQLQDPTVQDKPLLRTYLIYNCESLKETPLKGSFIKMSEDSQVSAEMRKEMRSLIDEWG